MDDYHHDTAHLQALDRVRRGKYAGNYTTEDVMMALRALTSCRNSGKCGEPDKHEGEIHRTFALLAEGKDG